VKQVCGR